MKTITLQPISEVLDWRHALSRERFFYYFGPCGTMSGATQDDAGL